MTSKTVFFFISVCGLFLLSCHGEKSYVTVPIKIDHNRILVEGEMLRNDGSWCKVWFWVDTGNPVFMVSSTLVKDMGFESEPDAEADNNYTGKEEPRYAVRIGGMVLNLDNVKTRVSDEPFWIYTSLHNEANLPSTVLKHYQVVIDYPGRKLTIGLPGSIRHEGVRIPASIHPETGIVQLSAEINSDSLSFALDLGASFSFASDSIIDHYISLNPEQSCITGTTGCANMWGWWPPEEQSFPVIRIPALNLGEAQLTGIGMAGIPRNSLGGISLGEWYSQKTTRPVEGFIGANAFNTFRIEIDYPGRAVYLKKVIEKDTYDMDIAGLTLRPERDSSYTIIGIPEKNNKPVFDSIFPGDKLIRIDTTPVKGLSMGTVMDLLRGQQGEVHQLIIERNRQFIKLNVRVKHLL